MTIREQKLIFTLTVAYMFAGYIVGIISCPPWQEGEGFTVFLFEVMCCLVPAFILLAISRKLSRVS